MLSFFIGQTYETDVTKKFNIYKLKLTNSADEEAKQVCIRNVFRCRNVFQKQASNNTYG